LSTLVVDASVAVKAFFPEDHSDRCRRLLAGRDRLLAPDLIYAEFASVAWKRCVREEIMPEDARAMVEDFLSFPIETESAADLISAATEIGIATQRTVYDCLYLSMAIRFDCLMVTADERLVNALRGGPLATVVRWIGSGGRS